MNNDRISNTPGGNLMLIGGLLFSFALIAYQAFRYELGDLGHLVFLAVMMFGAAQFGKGVWQWKYADRDAFLANRRNQNLFVDIPLEGRNTEILHQIEDALVEFIRTSKTIKINIHSVDTANNMGTIHLSGKEADAIFAQVFAILGYFAHAQSISLYPKPGQPADPELRGKRVLLASLKR